jgi:transposase
MIDLMSALPFWEGFRAVSYEEQTDGSLLISLDAVTDCGLCGHCGAQCALQHEQRQRQVRERDLFDRRVWLKVPVRRFDCLQCNRRVVEAISWLEKGARFTQRMRCWVEVLSELLPIAHVARLTGLHWHSIKQIDHQRLQRQHAAFDASGVRRLVMDEFALHKGHRYATVVLDADRTRVLWIGEGNSRAAIRPFFEQLGPTGCAQIEAVAMDMNTAFDLEVRQHCPHAEVVYDLFHVVAKFGREVIDRVRVDQANKLRDQPTARRVIKRSRWLLLRNQDHLDPPQAIELRELLNANEPLATVYLLKEELKGLWFAPSVQIAKRRWKNWQRLAISSQLTPLIKFTTHLRGYLRGIFASALYHMNTSVLEGVNNRIKVIKRMAYGYRDSEYFFLKVKAAFPGETR